MLLDYCTNTVFIYSSVLLQKSLVVGCSGTQALSAFYSEFLFVIMYTHCINADKLRHSARPNSLLRRNKFQSYRAGGRRYWRNLPDIVAHRLQHTRARASGRPPRTAADGI